ncbi:MAG: response regulator transcription factor [Acidimicrobiales bacterium]
MNDGTILVVDDDPVIVKLLEVNFEMEGYRVFSAADGAAGIEAARRLRPDVIVLDVMMPVMDGMEAARRLRADPDTARVPILLLSAKAQAPDVLAGLEVADGYVTKPFEPLELLDRVAQLLARSRSQQAGETSDGPPRSRPGTPR